MPATSLALRTASSAVALTAASTALRRFSKVFDPNQSRDYHGRWDYGGGGGRLRMAVTNDPMGAPYGSSGGGGSNPAELTGPFSRQITDAKADLNAANRHLHALNRGGTDPTDPDVLAAVAAVKQSEAKLQVLWASRRTAMGPQKPTVATVGSEQSVSDWLAANDPNYKPTATERMAAATNTPREYTIIRNGVRVRAIKDASGNFIPVTDSSGRMVLESGANTVNTSESPSLHNVPPGALRAKVAAASMKAVEVSQNVSTLLGAVASLGTQNVEPSTLSRVAVVAGALTTMAVALNVAARATNAPTLISAAGAAGSAVKTLRRELPYISQRVASINKPAIGQAISSASVGLQQLGRSIQDTKLGAQALQMATRTAFRATGGKIGPAVAYRPPVLTVVPSRSVRVTQGPAAKPTTITIKPPRYPGI